MLLSVHTYIRSTRARDAAGTLPAHLSRENSLRATDVGNSSTRVCAFHELVDVAVAACRIVVVHIVKTMRAGYSFHKSIRVYRHTFGLTVEGILAAGHFRGS